METFTDHVRAAISSLEFEILKLEIEGTRSGSVVSSSTGGKYRQWHWYHDRQREYVSKAALPIVKAECDRANQAKILRRKIEQLLDVIYTT